MATCPFETHDPTAYKWTDKAYDLLTDGQLRVDVIPAGDIRVIVARGPCPRCGDDVAFTMETSAAVPVPIGPLGKGGETTFDQYETIDVACRCEGVHPGRPAGATGCGIAFRVEIERQLS